MKNTNSNRTVRRLAYVLFCFLIQLNVTKVEAQENWEATKSESRSADSNASAEADPAIATKNMLQILRDGGLMMFPIVLCSFVLMIFVFERTVSLRRGRVIPRPFVKRFIMQLQEGQLNEEEALSLCDENRSPVAEVFAAAVKKWNRPCVEVEQAVLDAGERVANGLRKYLRIFNGISTVCPLLGLLGTVTGMISAFNAIANSDAMGRPEMLAGGISQALLTTAAGMSVAIPAIIFYLYFVSRVDRLIIDIDAAGQDVANAIACDGWKGKPKKSLAKKPAKKAGKASTQQKPNQKAAA